MKFLLGQQCLFRVFQATASFPPGDNGRSRQCSLPLHSSICHLINTLQVFGDISALRFVPSEVIPAVEKHIREMDTVQREIFASAQEEGEVSVKIKGTFLY